MAYPRRAIATTWIWNLTRCTAFLLLSFIIPKPSFADIALGTSAGAFLGFEVGASSAGLAGANTGVASGVSSQFWNPALLSGLSNSQVSVMHATWLGNLQYEWLGYARPLGPKLGTGSLSVAYFHMPSLSGVDEFDNPTGEFKVYDLALTLGLARPVVKGLNVGMNAKVIRQTLATVSGTGAAVDLGASVLVQGTTLGASVQNLGPSLSLGGGSYPLPQQARFGMSRSFFSDRLLLASDFNIPKTYYRDVRVGAEYRPHSMVAVRLGYRHVLGTEDDPSTGLSYGLGAHVGPVTLDYAMTPDNEFADVHRLSFGYTFAGPDHKPKPEPKKPERKPAQPPPPKGPPVIAFTPEKTQRSAADTPGPKPPERPAASQPPAAAPAPQQPPVQQASAPEPKAQPAAPNAAPNASDLFEVVLGSYQSEESAKAEIKALQILGFSVKNARVRLVSGAGYLVSLERFNSKGPAENLAASLSRLSFTPRVVAARP